MIIKRIARALGVLLLLCLGFVAFVAGSVVFSGRLAAPEHADAAIVLGAATWGDEPSPVFRERIRHAIWLYERGYVKRIIFTGAPDSPKEPPESVVARRYALSRGVPAGDILIEVSSRTTAENLFHAREVGRRNGLGTYLIVSDPLHMLRAMIFASDLGMEARRAPTPTSRYRSIAGSIRFLGREMYFYANYLLRGTLLTGPVRGELRR
jgi:uncharacterized SAM-binding protein YcdF (DUF218 family)